MSEDLARGGVVITGASTGIGRACALDLDRRGYRVFAGVRRAADAEALERDASDRLVTLTLDVTKADHIAAAVERVGEVVGQDGLVGLVNNAGIGIGGPLEHIAIEEVRWQFEVNVIAQVAVTQAFLPLLRRGPGRIVNIGSIAGRITTPLMTPYAASKHAMESISDGLRQELAPFDIHVSIVEPGAIQTPIWGKADQTAETIIAGLTDEARARYGPAIEALRALIRSQAKNAIPAERVADAIRDALQRKVPRTRYLIGSDAIGGAWLRRLLPDRTLDKVVAKRTRTH